MRADSHPIAIGSDQLREQLAWLKALGYRFKTLSRFVELRKSRAPGRYAALTFDDGSKDLLHNALPVLREYDAPATVFVVTDMVSCAEFFPWDVKRANEGKLRLRDEDRSLSWDQLCLLHDQGWEIGSHTVTHPLLCEIPLAYAEKEIITSKNVIESNLGITVKSFCYPRRFANLSVARAVEVAGYNSAVISFITVPLPNGALLPQYGYYTLNRIGIYREDSLFKLLTKALGIYDRIVNSNIYNFLRAKGTA